jgi:hypothetical protein
MFEILFISVIPLAFLLFVAFFATVTLHELGHAIPALLLTREEVTIYIGSLGDPGKSFHVSRGRLEIYCTRNPLLWYKGCCYSYTYDLSLNHQLLIVAGGPVASIVGTIASWFLLIASPEGSLFHLLSGSIFVISLLITVSILFPFYKVRYTSAGAPVYNDTLQIIRLIKRKLG